MSGGLSYPGYLHPARPRLDEYPMQKTYRIGFGCIRILTDRCRNPRGSWNRVDISVTDSVLKNEYPIGSAKFDLRLFDHDVRGTRWELTVNHGGCFSLKRRKTFQDHPVEREVHFYGSGNKIRGCFFLEKFKCSPIRAVAQLFFGFAMGEIHAITIKIRISNGSFVTEIDPPTIATPNQLQWFTNEISNISSGEDANTGDGAAPKKEREIASGTRGLINSVGASLNGVANGSLVNIENLYYGTNEEAKNKKQLQ